MTIDESIEFGKTCLEIIDDCKDSRTYDFFQTAIKILEQEPCENCVSRESVDTLVDELARAISDERCFMPKRGRETGEIMSDMLHLPSVYPKPKTGHNCNKDYADCDQFVCSECGIELQDWHKVVRDDEYDDISYQEYAFRFCPSCGCEIKEG